VKNYREHLRGDIVKLKKYLYVLRPLLACLWLEQARGPVPMRFQDLVDAIVTDAEVKAAIAELLVIKRRANEAEQGAALPAINRFLEFHLERLDHTNGPQPPERPDFSVLDHLLRDTVVSAHA
jgi:predicted nucleotidyltransferase